MGAAPNPPPPLRGRPGGGLFFSALFFFYANEGREPVHVHVRKAGGFSKFWVEPVELAFAHGMKIPELARAEALVEENKKLILEKWHEVFHS